MYFSVYPGWQMQCSCRVISSRDAHPSGSRVPWQVLFTGKAVRVLLRRNFAPPPPERVQDEVDTLRRRVDGANANKMTHECTGKLVAAVRKSFYRHDSSQGTKKHVQSGRNIWNLDLRLVKTVFVQLSILRTPKRVHYKWLAWGTLRTARCRVGVSSSCIGSLDHLWKIYI